MGRYPCMVTLRPGVESSPWVVMEKPPTGLLLHMAVSGLVETGNVYSGGAPGTGGAGGTAPTPMSTGAAGLAGSVYDVFECAASSGR